MKHDLNNLKDRWLDFKVKVRFGQYDLQIAIVIGTIIGFILGGCVNEYYN